MNQENRLLAYKPKNKILSTHIDNPKTKQKYYFKLYICRGVLSISYNKYNLYPKSGYAYEF